MWDPPTENMFSSRASYVLGFVFMAMTQTVVALAEISI